MTKPFWHSLENKTLKQLYDDPNVSADVKIEAFYEDVEEFITYAKKLADNPRTSREQREEIRRDLKKIHKMLTDFGKAL